VEWTSSYAYGADEAGWKNPDPKYDNTEEPYGFTGKEEDTDVGLHYFGARYYSAYLGRWISPDPPVVHGSAAGANYFQYAANAPYIAIDPDGNWVNVLIGAIVGSIVGSANEIIKRGGIRSIADAGWVILAGIRGGGIGAAAGSGNAWLAAAASTADQQVQMMYDSGGDMSILTQAEFHKQSAVVFGSSVAASYAGQGIGRLKGGMVFNAAASYGVGVGTAATNQMVLTGRGLRGEDWERFLKDQAISSTVSFGGSLVGEEIRTGLSGGGGGSEFVAENEQPSDGVYQGPTEWSGSPQELQDLARRGGIQVHEMNSVLLGVAENDKPAYLFYETGNTIKKQSVGEVMDFAWRLSRPSSDSPREVGVLFTVNNNTLEARVFLGRPGWGSVSMPSHEVFEQSDIYSYWGKPIAQGHTHPYGRGESVRMEAEGVLGSRTVTVTQQRAISEGDAVINRAWQSWARRNNSNFYSFVKTVDPYGRLLHY
jgi:RHS repeat-associated protein